MFQHNFLKSGSLSSNETDIPDTVVGGPDTPLGPPTLTPLAAVSVVQLETRRQTTAGVSCDSGRQQILEAPPSVDSLNGQSHC